MKKILTVGLILALLVLPMTAQAREWQTFAADDENIVYTGRWTKNEKGVMCGTFESSIRIRFTGTSLGGGQGSSGTVNASLDGGPFESKTLGGTIYKDLEDGEHTLTMIAGAQQAFPRCGGFKVDPGKQLLKPEERETIEFIGDSILEGYVPGSNSSANSYGLLTAEKLSRDCSIVAFGGITMTAGHGSPDTQGMVRRYFMAKEFQQGEKDVPAWDLSAYVPDTVVINLGTNDNGVSEPEFMLATTEFLSRLRAAYPEAPIYVLIPFNQRHADTLRTVVAEDKDDKTVLVETKDWNVTLSEDNLHPSVAGHEIAAEKLAEVLAQPLTTEAPSAAPTEATETADPENTAAGETMTAPPVQEEKGDGPHWVLPAILAFVAVAAAAVGVILIVRRKK